MEWEQRLTEAGCRITESRRSVMHVLEEASAPLQPQAILEQGRLTHPGLGLVTVYRTLALLSELCLVRRVHGEDGCHGYVLATPGHRHHLICEHCGEAVEFPGDDGLQALVERVEACTGYQVHDHLLQFFGLCPECQDDLH